MISIPSLSTIRYAVGCSVITLTAFVSSCVRHRSSDVSALQGFLDMLRDLLSDSNPMVVANAVAALSEIEENSPTEVFKINTHNLNKLLAALNECTEWGQVSPSISDRDQQGN